MEVKSLLILLPALILCTLIVPAMSQQNEDLKVLLTVSDGNTGVINMFGTGETDNSLYTPLYDAGLNEEVTELFYPIVSPDGQSFARVEQTPGGRFLVVRSIEGGSLVRNASISESAEQPQWFSDSIRIFYEDRKQFSSDFRALNIETGGDVLLTNTEVPVQGNATLSPDGRFILYFKDVEVNEPDLFLQLQTPYLYDVLRKSETALVDPGSTKGVDGKAIRGVFLKTDFLQRRRHVAWGPDSEKVVLMAELLLDREGDPSPESSKFGLVKVDLGGPIETLVETGPNDSRNPTIFHFSPDGNAVVFNMSVFDDGLGFFAPHVLKFSHVTGQLEDLVRGTLPGPTSSDPPFWPLNPWSNDGRKVLYIPDGENALYAMSREGENKVRLTPDLGGSGDLIDAQWTDVERRIPAIEIEMVDMSGKLFLKLLKAGRPLSYRIIERLDAEGKDVKGVAADGAVKILIRVRVGSKTSSQATVTFSLKSDDGAIGTSGQPFYDGKFSQIDNTGSLDSRFTLDTRDARRGQVAFILYTAPDDFVRTVSDETGVMRIISPSIIIDGKKLPFDHQIEIVRPPIMLLHGLWSNRHTWTWPLVKDPRFNEIIHLEDYKKTNASAFLTNLNVPRVGVQRALELVREKGHAATRADVIAHSMGGILSRLYISSFLDMIEYERKDNFDDGDIHKLITVDTPHQGSPWGNFLEDNINNGGITMLAIRDTQLTPRGFCTNCGAVRDLKTNGEILSNLPEVSVPSHAVVGTGGDNVPASFPALVGSEAWSFILLAILRDQGFSIGDLFSESHDLIVSETSQRGKLPFCPKSTFEFKSVPMNEVGIHTTMTTEVRVSNRCVELLNKGTTESEFSEKFPARQEKTLEPRLEDDRVFKQVPEIIEGGIIITSPTSGALVEPGASISMVVEASPEFVPVRVLVASDFVAFATDGSAPFEFSLPVPETAVGSIMVSAYAFDSADNMAVTDPVFIETDLQANVESLSLVPAKLLLYSYASTEQLDAIGHYDDGIDRILTSPQNGTLYASLDEGIATIADDGSVTGHKVGSTVLSATVGENSATAEIIVMSVKGDFDGNGVFDLRDLGNLVSCFSEEAGSPGFATPTLECRDFFDFDEDFDVDLDDYSNFEMVSSADLSSDCNVNGATDPLDLLNGTSSDINVNGIPDECEELLLPYSIYWESLRDEILEPLDKKIFDTLDLDPDALIDPNDLLDLLDRLGNTE